MTNSNFPYTPSIYEKAKERLLSVWKKKRVLALLKAQADNYQKLEDIVLNIKTILDFENTSGIGLDIWGRIYDEPRGGLDDPDYKEIISLKILSLAMKGRVPDLVYALETIVSTPIEVLTDFPAGLRVIIETQDGVNSNTQNRIHHFITRIAPVGVDTRVIEGQEGMFRFDTTGLDTSPLGRIL